MTIETKDAKAMRDNFRFASLRIKTKKVNGRVYWYGENEVDGLYLKHNPKTSSWARTSKKAAVEILNKYGITAEQFIAYEKGELEIVEVNDEYKPQCDWENPHNYEATGANHARNLYTTETETATTELPTGDITVKSGTEAWVIVGKYFPNGLNFSHTTKGFNRETNFSYTNDDVIFAIAFSTPDNSRIEYIEIINSNESGSKRHVLTVYINHDAEVTTATDANEEIINCTDGTIITDDAYTQMIHAELANAQIASGNYGIKINDEWVYFTDHKITRIDAERKLGFSFEYTWQGRKQFRHNGRVISREGVIKFFENKETAKAQEKSFREFFINPDAPKHGFFQVQISPTFADSCEHNYTRYFEYYSDAINFVNDAINFCGDVPAHITIKRDKQAGKVYYHRTPDGTVYVDKPDTNFFKNYSATEIKTRIDAINRAIKANEDFTFDCIKNQKSDATTDCNITRTNFNLEDTRNFYEFVLHENAPATIAETDGSEEDDDDSEVFDLLPSVDELNDVDLTKSAYFDGRADLGYIFKLSVAINRSFDGTRPWTLESIDGNITVEGRTWQDYAKFIITDTDGSEEDDFADEMPALFPAEDSDDDDELIDPPELPPADDFATKLAELKAKQTAAKIVLGEKDAALLKAQEEYEKAHEAWCETNYAIDRLVRKKSDELVAKFNALPITNLKIKTSDGEEFSTNQNFVGISTLYGNYTIIAKSQKSYYRCESYKTPAQVETVINQLKDAIERGDREFTFPTIEELTTPEIDKDATADSLTRAMTIALEHYQGFCRVGNLTAATNELSLYNICRKAMSELWKEGSGMKKIPIKFRGLGIDGVTYYGDLYHARREVGIHVIGSGTFEVDPDSVAQLIGYDVDGKEVYEGDTLTDILGNEYTAKTRIELTCDDKQSYTGKAYYAGSVDNLKLKEEAA